ncbi:MAG: hypothetical protein MUE53_05255 [Chitinophagales bacterium]|nr:hypothetical protein [Chitinophagales bacterium]
MIRLLYIIFLFFWVHSAHAFSYAEHEFIGNKAFERFYDLYKSKSPIFWQLFQHKKTDSAILFTRLSKFTPITYGSINALGGDHSSNPLKLEELLHTMNSKLLKSIYLQNEYKSKFYANAPDLDLVAIDGDYGAMPIFNMCHFYAYNKTLTQHFYMFDEKTIRDILDPQDIIKGMRKLNKHNALNMYASMHTAAIVLAERAASFALAKQDNQAEILMNYALLYNGFADHFLQDAFASGHLLVNRSVLNSLTNNKGVHDFYCEYGSKTANLKGEIWTAYGDNFLNAHKENLHDVDSIHLIHYPEITDETNRIINAQVFSLQEVLIAFEQAYTSSETYKSILFQIPFNQKDNLTEKESKANFILRRFQALSFVPIPYGTKIDSQIVEQNIHQNIAFKNAIQTPYYRNYVLSRVANSAMVSIDPILFNLNNQFPIFDGIDFRLNYKLLFYGYHLNGDGGKRGNLDHWHGLTSSMSFGNIIDPKLDYINRVFLFKTGIRNNFDFWLTNKNMFGIFTNNEIGFIKSGSSYSPLYSSSLGIQLGSLLNINYYNLPFWIRFPLQLVLPLKIYSSANFSSGYKPFYSLGFQIDLAF